MPEQQMLPEPIELRLPGYRCKFRVTGFERKRNHGPVLTWAIADGQRDTDPEEKPAPWHPARDVVTLMRLADVLSDKHTFPVNAEKLYGPRGRGVLIPRPV